MVNECQYWLPVDQLHWLRAAIPTCVLRFWTDDARSGSVGLGAVRQLLTQAMV
jgi:hypothetical protein